MSAENTADEKQKRRWFRRGTPELEEEVESEESRALTAGKGRVTRGRRAGDDEDRGGNVVTRFFSGAAEYLEGVRSELAKVSWPEREDTRRLSILVIIATILASIVLGIISLSFTELFRLGLGDPIIFVVFFAIVGVAAFLIYRRRSTDNISPY